MRILFVSFYYLPDPSPSSFKISGIVRELSSLIPPNGSIDIITTRPNRYGDSLEAPEFEENGLVRIHRIACPAHQGNLVGHAKSFWHFATKAIQLAQRHQYDLIYATSSRLMTAALGAFLARSQKTSFYLDIRDIFVDTIQDAFPKPLVWASKPFFSAIEKWSVQKAKRVNLVSEGFKDYFLKRYPHQSYTYLTNGIDDEFLKEDYGNNLPTQPSPPNPIQVLYAGNIGEGQGLHRIIPDLASRLDGQATFTIIGDGKYKNALRETLESRHIQNVTLLNPMKREALIPFYQQADVLFLHLNDYEAFKKSLPSKLFEYAVFGKPIWAGVSGYAAQFIRSELPNAQVFSPCNYEEAILALQNLLFQPTPRKEFIQKYTRKAISQTIARDLLELLQQKNS